MTLQWDDSSKQCSSRPREEHDAAKNRHHPQPLTCVQRFPEHNRCEDKGDHGLEREQDAGFTGRQPAQPKGVEGDRGASSAPLWKARS